MSLQALPYSPLSPPLPPATNPDPPAMADTATATATATSLPDWALLERIICSRDDTSLPAADPTAAPPSPPSPIPFPSPTPMALQSLALAYRDSPHSLPPLARSPDPPAMAAAASLLDWALLDPFIFLRDDTFAAADPSASPIPRFPIPLPSTFPNVLQTLALAYRDSPCSPPPPARNPDPPAMAAAAAAASLSDWALLDRFIFVRDDTSFPAADPTTASSTNSLGDKISVCFQLHDPPRPSVIYLSWPAGDLEYVRFDVVAAHRDAVLFQMVYPVPVPRREYPHKMYDYFLYRAGGAAPSLDRLPSVYGTLPEFWAMFKAGSFRHTDQNLRRLECLDMGILRRGEDDVAVAELQIIRASEDPELHVLIPSRSGSSRWQSKKMRVVHGAAELDLEQFLWNWSADAVVPFGRYLCWVDYRQGAILLCDVFNDSRELRYLALPAKLPGMYHHGFGRSLADTFMTVGVNEESGVMQFVRVVDGNGKMIRSEYIPESGFVAASWTLEITEKDEMIWKKGAVVRSDDLFLSEAFAKLPPMPLQFPHVSLNDPSIVYFVMANQGHPMDGIEYDNAWLVAIDMPNKTVKSSFQYIKREESKSDEDTSFVMAKSWDFQTFIPSEFPKYLKLHNTSARATRTRKAYPYGKKRKYGC